MPRSYQVTGWAAVLAGVLVLAGQGGGLVFGANSDAAKVTYGLLFGGGIVALGVALWGLRDLTGVTRRGRIGVWLALAGVVLLGLFFMQALISVIRTGEVPEVIVLFALGFLLALVGQVLFAPDLRRSLGGGWVLPLVASVGIIVALAVEADPFHDIGLFVFEGAWVALGASILRLTHSRIAPKASDTA